MSNLRVNFDISGIAELFGDFKMELEQDLQKAVGLLAAQTNAHVKELAAQELHSSLKIFQDAVGFEEVTSGVWVVSIAQEALWIEDGLPAGFDEKPGLLKRNTKTSKDGFQYRVIPFDQGAAPSQSTDYNAGLINQVKAELKQRKIPFKKIEKNSDGSPRTGRLHTFSIDSEKPSAKASTGALARVNIYQSINKDTGKAKRDILTFRTVSTNPAMADKWLHPGLAPKLFLDRSAEWCENLWDQTILPSILEKWK